MLNYDGTVYDPFNDHSEEQKRLYEEIANIVKSRFGASRVILFNHIIRARGASRPADQCDHTHKNPIFNPHVDFDPDGAAAKLKEVIGEEEAIKVLKSRFQIVNVWKPLGLNPITNIPLTICDYQTVDLKNDIHLSEIRGSTSGYAITHINGQQNWYYLCNMKWNEMFVFKMFDSHSHLAQFGAHTAFIDESTHQDNVANNPVSKCVV